MTSQGMDSFRYHHVDANKMYWEKTWQQLHENALSNIEQILKTEPPKIATVRPPTTRHENYQN